MKILDYLRQGSIQKRNVKLFILCVGFTCVLCACGSKGEGEKIEAEKNETELKETVQEPKQEKETFSFSEWNLDSYGIDEEFKIDQYYMTIQDSEKNNSIILYDTGDGYECTCLENGNGRLNIVSPRNRALPNHDYRILGKYELDDSALKNTTITNFSSEKSESGQSSTYYIDATISSTEKETPFLVAYKIYSEETDYSESRVGVVTNGELVVFDSVTRKSDVNEKFDVKILGSIDFQPFDNTQIFYNEIDYEITYDVRGQFEEKQSYKRFWGTTPFSLNDNAAIGILRMQINCNSEQGITNNYKDVLVANGTGKVTTFLEIPGDQAPEPTYQFIADGIITFESVN
mgnify:FL=1